jgi:hypothetical protein
MAGRLGAAFFDMRGTPVKAPAASTAATTAKS